MNAIIQFSGAEIIKKIPQVNEDDEYFGDVHKFFAGVTLWNTLETLSTREIFCVKKIQVARAYRVIIFDLSVKYIKHFVHAYLATQRRLNKLPREITAKIIYNIVQEEIITNIEIRFNDNSIKFNIIPCIPINNEIFADLGSQFGGQTFWLALDTLSTYEIHKCYEISVQDHFCFRLFSRWNEIFVLIYLATQRGSIKLPREIVEIIFICLRKLGLPPFEVEN